MKQAIESEINVDTNIYSQDRVKMVITSRLSQSSNLLSLDDYIDIEFYGYGDGGLRLFTTKLKDLIDLLIKSVDHEKLKKYPSFQF